MNNLDPDVITGLCVVVAIVIIALAVVLYFTYRTVASARNEHRDSLPSSPQTHQSTWRPETLPEPWPEDELRSSETGEPLIRFGSRKKSPSMLGKINWGNPFSQTSAKVSPEVGICPLCRGEFEGQYNIIRCETCNTPYHQHCWDDFGRQCLICNEA
jgi:hypothetical protein